MLRGDGRLPPVVALALLAVAMPPTHGGGGDGQSPASCDPDAGACAAGVAQRRLLAAGWDEVLAVRAPQFVELVPAVDQGAPGSFVQRRRFVHPGCADRPEWRFMWPTSLAEGFTCDDYAAGRINNDHCDSDVGFEFESGTWVLARHACPVACAACCDLSPLCEERPDPAACRAKCSAPRNVSAAGHVATLTDAYELFLAHADDLAPGGTANGSYAMYQQHQNGIDTPLTRNHTVTLLVPFDGQTTLIDDKELILFSSTPFSKVRYTTDGTDPSDSVGTEATRVRVEQTMQLKAVGYMQLDTHSLPPSNISTVSITIKASPPTMTVVECRMQNGESLHFTRSAPYANQSCTLARVEVAAVGARANATRLRYVVNRQDPGTSNPQGRRSVMITLVGPGPAGDTPGVNQTDSVTVAGPTRVSARAWRLNTTPSDIVLSPYILLGSAQVDRLGWMGSVGYWKFTPEYLHGTYTRAVSRDQGCQERLATQISPAAVWDVSGVLGSAVLRGPACKTGVWDLDYHLSPNLTWFIGPSPPLRGAALGTDGRQCKVEGETCKGAGDVQGMGLAFDSINRGLYVLDDVTDALHRGTFPVEMLTVEAVISIDTNVGVALAGIAAARLDGIEVGGFRYGKGWSVGYSVHVVSDTVSLIFSLAVAAAQVQVGMGGLQDVKAQVPRSRIKPGQLIHVVCIYDGAEAIIYLDGVELARQHLCQGSALEEGVAGCGAILYRDEADVMHSGNRALGLTLGVMDSLGDARKASHQGTLREIRLFKQALSPQQVKAAAARALDLELVEVACMPGNYGPYDGLEPCAPCQPGTISVYLQSSSCESCARDFYSPGPGSSECFLCPDGYATLDVGSSECTRDACLLGTHDCDPLATCRTSNASNTGFVCDCAKGFPGDGIGKGEGACQPLCGDGIVAGGETCDDGGLVVGDGCSEMCEIESDFECFNSPLGTSVCVCSGPPQKCCVAEHSLCLRAMARAGRPRGGHSAASAEADGHTDSPRSACLTAFSSCLQKAQGGAGGMPPAPDVPLFRLGQSQTYGLSRDDDLANVTRVPSACDAVQLQRCQLLESKCALTDATEDECLLLVTRCLAAVQCKQPDQTP